MLKARIDRSNRMLQGVSHTPAFEHVKDLDLRNTLATGSKYKDDWANELHPTAKGFAAVTAKFAAVIR